MRSPAHFGLPAKFKDWRPGQWQGIFEALNPRFSVVGLDMPPGTGKTVAYIAAAVMYGLKAVVVTDTLHLETQLMEDFEELGMKRIHGQNNYPCDYDPLTRLGGVTVDEGPCHIGQICGKKEDMTCQYYGALKEAQESQLMVTNYAYWLTTGMNSPEPLFYPSLLVLDEGHVAPQRLCDALAINLPFSLSMYRYVEDFPWKSTASIWARWFEDQAFRVARKYNEIVGRNPRPSVQTLKILRRLKRLHKDLERGVSVGREEWVYSKTQEGVRWEPLWPAAYNPLLMQGAERALFVSATLSPKILELCGVERYSMYQCPSPFKRQNRPIYVASGVDMNRDMPKEDLLRWVKEADRWIGPRQDRRGIVHTHSYVYAKFLKDNSKYGRFIQVHERRESQDALNKYRRTPPPVVLASPTLVAGVDLPGNDCRYQIIGKMPFPYKGDPVNRARCDSDPGYFAHQTSTDLQQMYGRPVRTMEDWAETAIIDSNFSWFYQRNTKHFAPWFREVVQYVGDEVPVPLAP